MCTPVYGVSPSPPPPIAGSFSCRPCHEEFYKLWSTSHHGLAMQPFAPALANDWKTTGPTEIKIGAHAYHFDPSGAVIETTTASASAEKRYPIAQVMGGKNVCYFLTPIERGMLQVLPLAYDLNRREWFDMPASAVRHFGHAGDSALDWHERPLTFNTSCHGCHVSQLSTNYDTGADVYHTTWAEPGINCETCHESALNHVAFFKALPSGQPTPADPKIISWRKFSPAQSVETCAPCHAKMIPLSASFKPGERFFDHYDLVGPEDPDFYPDGRDLGENYTLTSWRMNACARSGQLTCVHCHTSSGRYRFNSEKPEEANKACLPCHAERVKNAPAHTHHAADSKASRCIACHMPMTEFARMRRSDHSLRPPAPAATLAFKSPNACNVCHADRDAAWSAAKVHEWFSPGTADGLVRNPSANQPAPSSPNPQPTTHNSQLSSSSTPRQDLLIARGRLIEAARRGDWSRLPDMLAFISASTSSSIPHSALRTPHSALPESEMFSVALVRLLRGCPDSRAGAALVASLSDPSPLVRAAAADSLGQHLAPSVIPALARAAADEYRLVRVRAAMTLASVPREAIPESSRTAVARAEAELVESLNARPDDAVSRYNLGNFHLERGDLDRALAQYQVSLRLAPASVAALVNASMAWSRKGDAAKSEQCLRDALKADPASAAANFNLGLLLGEKGDLAGAETALRASLKTDPANPAAAYNLAVIVAEKNVSEAVTLLRGAVARQPEDPKYAYTLGFYLARQGDATGAAAVLEKAAAAKPAHADLYWLLGRIYEERGNTSSAWRVYRQAAANPALSAEDRERFTQRAQAVQ